MTSSVKHFQTRSGASSEMAHEVALALAPNAAAVPDARGLHGYRLWSERDTVELVTFTVGANEYQLS